MEGMCDEPSECPHPQSPKSPASAQPCLCSSFLTHRSQVILEQIPPPHHFLCEQWVKHPSNPIVTSK